MYKIKLMASFMGMYSVSKVQKCNIDVCTYVEHEYKHLHVVYTSGPINSCDRVDWQQT